ncbi:YdiU family protein [Thalassotalea psychrophila]|uniref:Protein nucleotidyltransferase YdiU n=1 Tax=Thalassotalea psychrophila TaxID=3065647 RepID=A0ABY9TUY1_9GAMM|nr:YdiU family protein [Colwelliaceae bacterium SQ149]
MLQFNNTYHKLGDKFYQTAMPNKVSNPALLFWNDMLANDLRLDTAFCRDKSKLALYFSGNKIISGSVPVALAYSGHQFGQFNPYMGDGRAHLLGEVCDKDNIQRDIQLKGSGQTPYSRRGDGLCAIGPAIREYIMSEAMYALGVPTSRCLAVVSTGETVYRESEKPGAVVTRIAASHIRVGTFQHFSARGDVESLTALTEYTINRHYPTIDINTDGYILELIKSVGAKQIELIVQWMRVGFIHGVMNTDNCAISGETIDFGPCAMLGVYHPGTVYSSIDKNGRYAFGNQPNIAQWNMARFAESLIPLIDEDAEKAVELVKPIILQFAEDFNNAYYGMLASKLGVHSLALIDKSFIKEILDIMQNQELDYTLTFVQLAQSLNDNEQAEQLKAALGKWYNNWLTLLQEANIDHNTAEELMKVSNPVVIPRNHHVEAILQECETSGDLSSADRFLKVLRSPYQQLPHTNEFQDLPKDGDVNYHTFCGT